MTDRDWLRFAEKYVVDENGCWLWIGGTNSGRYGMFRVQGHTRAAHVLTYERAYGEVPWGRYLKHTCRQGLCCNPDHLTLETATEKYDRVQRTETTEQRLWGRIGVAGPNDCWEWLGEPFGNNYGRIDIRNKNYQAHRVAWELTKGPIPVGLLVLHRCDNRRCCNPAHLFLGTHNDNEADKHGKGRGAVGKRHGAYTKPESRRRGTLNGKCLLTDDQVCELRERYASGGVTMKQLAGAYGISEPTVRQIVTGFTWKHVGGPIAPVKTPRPPLTEAEKVEIVRRWQAREKITVLMREYRIGHAALWAIIDTVVGLAVRGIA